MEIIELKNAIRKTKKSLDWVNSRLEMTEQRANELKRQINRNYLI